MKQEYHDAMDRVRLSGEAAGRILQAMEEAQEGKNAFLEKRDPDFQKFPKFPG